MILLETNWTLFFGRLHPLIVHLPIGFLLIAAVMEYFARKPKYQHISNATSFVLFAGALSAVAAVGVGLMLANDGGYEGDTLFWHKWMGIGVAIVSILAWLIKSGRWKAQSRVYSGLMIGMVVLLTFTGHYGGTLTHGSNYLFQYAPAPIAALFGAGSSSQIERVNINDPDSIIVFNHIIQPMLDATCVECHNEDKSKGGLQLHTVEALQEGGEGGAVLVANNPTESELFHRVTLPQDAKKFMPADNKTPLSYGQVKLLEWWIENGASFESSLTQVEVPEDIKLILEESLGISTKKKPYVETAKVEAAPAETLEKINQTGLTVIPIAANNNFLDVKPTAAGVAVTREQLAALSPVSEQIAWVNFARAELTDEDLKLFENTPNLTRLRIELNAITDEGIKHLENLEHLDYLNVYGTEITDAAIESFRKMKGLKKLFIWQTNITREAVEELQKNRPDIQIEMGLELQQANAEG